MEYIPQAEDDQEAAHDQAVVLLEKVELLLEEIQDWGTFERLVVGLGSVLPREVWREHLAKLRELKERP